MTSHPPSTRIPKSLFALIALYCAASLVHFAHNAEFIADYPNLPAWLTRSKVYLAWLAVTSVGVFGIVLLRLRHRSWGLVVVAAYAVLGFAGLDHYSVAPMARHTFAMNATIGCEVACASILFAAALLLLRRSSRSLPSASDA